MAQQQQAQTRPVSLGPVSSAYLAELKTETDQLDASLTTNAARLVNDEIKRLEQGGPKKVVPLVEAHHARPQAVAVKVKIPIHEFPKFNFVGKLLGPKGTSLKRLQEETGTKMSILGKGSMRDKSKEEEMKKEGGKYSHLNEDLHLLIEVYSEISDCYSRLSHALAEVHKFLTPDYNDEIAQEQMQQMMYLSNGEKGTTRGGGARGGVRGGARGGLLGGPPAAPGARGAPRGAPRGAARGAPRGAAVGRGRPPMPAPPPAMDTSYEDYSASAYDEYADPYARDPYDTSYGGGDTQYFDYGHGSSAAGYEDSYADSTWATPAAAPMKAPPARGRGQFRAHPYAGGRGAAY